MAAEPMFFEDYRIGERFAIGETGFERAAILDFIRAYDPPALARFEAGGEVVASGLHVACAAMRLIVEWRSRLRAAAQARGEALAPLGVAAGLEDVRWPHPVRAGDAVRLSVETISLRETRRPQWGLVGSRIVGLAPSGAEAVRFSSLVMTARRSA